MNPAAQSALIERWRLRPEGMRYPPASEHALSQFELAFGPIPTDFRWFLSVCGGGVVGSEWVDGISQLTATHEKYNREKGPRGWHSSSVFVIGWDGAGNPFGISRVSGAVLVEDHNSGDSYELSPSFEDFLTKGMLGHAL
jgi:hypothetical protein